MDTVGTSDNVSINLFASDQNAATEEKTDFKIDKATIIKKNHRYLT